MNHIVFGFEHYNPLGLIRSLGENGIQPIGIIVNNNNRRLTSNSKYLKKVHFVSTIEEGYNLLQNKYGKDGKDFIYTSDDQITAYLDHHYDDLKNKFYFNNAGKADRINYFMDKWNICQIASDVGIKVANTITISKKEFQRGNVNFDKIVFPVITKAIKSTLDNWKGESFICYSTDELKHALSSMRGEAVLVQEYIEKKNELCLDGCSWNKGKNVLISIASEYKYILPDTYSPLMNVYSFRNRDLLAKLENMFQIIGFEGIFSIEFLIDKNNELYFLEVNFRNSTWSYASTILGLPLPVIWSNKMINCLMESIYIPNKEITAMVEFSDFKNRVKDGKPYKISLFMWIKEFLNAECTYYWSKSDIKPIIYFIISIIIGKLKRLW